MTAREVVLEAGAPWGFRMHGGVDHNQPLRISRVNPGSKAAQRGIREGDLISSINGQSTKKLTNFEAHGLLRNAGGILKLGLNEDPDGSPKRRQYRTVHQETLQETIKKSSVTTYSVTKTLETTDSHSDTKDENLITEREQFSSNGTSNTIPPSNLLVTKKSNSSSSSSPTLTKEGDLRNTSSDHAQASQRSSCTNCTLSPSSPSILSEDGIRVAVSRGQDNKDKQIVIDNIMNDSQSSSRSKKRRQRRKNQRKIVETREDNTQNSSIDRNTSETVTGELKNVLKEEYTVQSPAELAKDNRSGHKTVKPIKSRSLDDDDLVKIQEVSELSESEEKDTQAIVSEASESEVEWEETENLVTPTPLHGSLSTFTLPIEACTSEQVTLMSPEEEKTLRDFLQGLNLVNGPEEAAKQVCEKNSLESIKQKKARKKAELEQYFHPIYQNPRYLDVISEESSDRDSDKEQTNKTRILRKGTPEQDVPIVPPKIPPRLNKNMKKYLPPVEQAPAVLVDTKFIDIPIKSGAICSATVTTEEKASASVVEVVYLNSSETDSAEELESGSSDSYVLGSENSSCEDISEETLVNEKTEHLISDQKEQKRVTCKNDILSELSSEDITESNENLKTISTSTYNFTVKSNKNFNDVKEDTVNIDLFSQLTPPPTPDNISPKSTNEPKLEFNTNKHRLDFIIEKENYKNGKFSTLINNINSTLLDVTYSNIITPPISQNDKYQHLVNDLQKDNEFSKNLNISSEEGIIYTNSISPPPPSRSRSSSRSGSSSRESSQCTAKYNPSSSSITDVISLAKNEELNYYEALTLREICLKFLLALPFGREILEELADVSKSIESFTKSLPSSVLTKLVPNLAQFVDRSHTNNNYISYDLSVRLPPKTLQEDINGINVTSSLKESNEQTKSEINYSNEQLNVEDPIKKIIVNINEPPVERIIPISIEPDQKANVKESINAKKEINIPINIIKDREIDVKENIFLKEVIIPISIKKDSTLFNDESLKKQVNVPFDVERMTTPDHKEIIIPIQKETKNQTKEGSMWTGKEINIPIVKDWVGMPIDKDPNILLCLSPKQKDQLEKTSQISNEAGKLLELHEKFINRRSCHEEMRKDFEEKVTVTTSQPENSSRLLSIIKEEPATSADDKDFIYFVEKEPNPNLTSTLPRSTMKSRLDAKDLTEWLNLARNKSMSESNLTTAPDIPENNLRNYFNKPAAPARRTSLPQELYEKQMVYIQEKEREIQRQLEALEEEKRKLNSDMSPSKQFHAEDYHFSRKGDFAESKRRPASMPLIPTEYFRQQMYQEYMDKFTQREERKQHKIIKVTSSKDVNQDDENHSKREIIHPIQIEDEFMSKVKQKQLEGKLEKVKSSEKEQEGVAAEETKEEHNEPPVLVMDGERLKEAKELPKHLQEFVGPDGIWSPGQKIDFSSTKETKTKEYDSQDETIPPVWTPKSSNSSPTAERKEFRSVNFQSPVLGRRNRTSSENLGSQKQTPAPPWKNPDYHSDTGSASSILDRKLSTSRSTPATGFSDFSSTSRLPKAQNPTITLLQKAREGQLPKGALYIEQEQRQYRPKNERPPIAGPGEVLYQIKHEYTSESDNERPRKMTDLGPRKFEGIGPVARDGMPLVLRSEIKDQNQSKWYKRMYDTIHKQKPHNDEYVTIRYKQKRAQYPYTSGYLSEPEPGAYDSDFTDYKYQTLDRKRPPQQDRSFDYNSSTMPRPTVNRSISSDIVRNTSDYYKTKPGRIEHYTPGHSSISEKEAKQWWDEVMDIFDGHLEQQNRLQPQSHPKSFINQAYKESGYESDSTLVFRRREEAASQISPKEQREAYKVIQKGGDIPLHGLRKPAPERPKDPEPPVPPPKGISARSLEPESPRRYVENEVTIHYKTPVRQEIKEYLSEDELAHRQAETMKKIYQEERRKKYLQELQDMNSRRHTDNFIPSQKSPISLNRYDDFEELAPSLKPRPRSPEPRLCARALYNFVGQTSRELTFRKGDIIYLRRQIDKNWYEGELNAMVGLFPANYVEIIPFEGLKSKSTMRKPHEGQARAKYNFVAQTHLELSLAKGELVVITRKVDDNWFEGKIGGRKGIFPANYVEVLIDAQTPPATNTKPVASPAAHSLLLNGSSGGKESMGSHSYTPNLPNNQLGSSYHAKPVQVLSNGSYGSLNTKKNAALSQALHIETQSEPTPYRAMYKYKPQNDDELELLEGDTVYVLEKCDDGWFVGSSDRTGAFGTFPGNYVEKI